MIVIVISAVLLLSIVMYIVIDFVSFSDSIVRERERERDRDRNCDCDCDFCCFIVKYIDFYCY